MSGHLTDTSMEMDDVFYIIYCFLSLYLYVFLFNRAELVS